MRRAGSTPVTRTIKQGHSKVGALALYFGYGEPSHKDNERKEQEGAGEENAPCCQNHIKSTCCIE